MGFVRRWLWRRASERWVDGALELGHRVSFLFGYVGAGIVYVSPREVDELGGIGDFLARAPFLDEVDDIFLDFTILERKTNPLASLNTVSYDTIPFFRVQTQIYEGFTYSIVTHAHCRGNVGVSPEAALCKIDALFFKVLKFLGAC